MIQVSGLSKSYGDQVLFDEVAFSINPGERIGLVGRNDHGKSTLFRIISGIEEADSGNIHFSDGYRVGHLSQHLVFTEETALQEAALGLPKREDGWEETYKVEAILQGLGFTKSEIEAAPENLSGGFQVRLNLAKLIASDPNLLLLDEPTNYLDIVSLRWLTNFMRSWQHELLLITHDQGFMNQIITHTLGIHRAKVRKVQGKTEKYYAQLELEEEVHEQSRVNQEKKRQDAERFIRTFRAKASKAKAVQSRIKALERMESLDKLDEISELDFRFNYQSLPGKRLLDLKDVAFGYQKDDFLFQDLTLSVGPRDKIAVIGRNGKGKSTLLRLIANEIQAAQGNRTTSPNLEIAYFGQTNVERLDPQLSIEEELLSATSTHNRTQARTIAGLMMFEGDAALKQIAVLSGGEKSRVLLGKLLLTPANLLILDEPTNHLDMHSTEALTEAVREFPGAVIIVTHSESLLKDLAERLVIFDRGKAEVFEGGYDDFLRRIGWEEEGGVVKEDETGEGNSPDRNLSKKELRRLRAELNQRKSQVLSPLQKAIARLEKEIVELEAEVEKNTAELIEITKDGYGDDGAKLSRLIHQSKQLIEEKFEALEEVSKELEEKQKEFEE